MFPMIFQSSMSSGKSRCDVPSGTTQEQDYFLSLFFFHVALSTSSIGCEELAKKKVTNVNYKLEKHYKHNFKNAGI